MAVNNNMKLRCFEYQEVLTVWQIFEVHDRLETW